MLEFSVKRLRVDFTLEVEARVEDPVVGLFGPSGAGKSSLLFFLAGLDRRAAGRCVLDGRVLHDSAAGIFVPPQERRVALVFQDQQLFPHLSVRGNLSYGWRRGRRARGRTFWQRVVDLLDLGAFLERKPESLSGGEKQRVALGRALLSGPRLLLLDEAVSSQDKQRRQRILGFLRRIRQEFSLPMVVVSHALSDILELTDRLLVLDHGRLLAQGPFLEVIRDEPVLDLAHGLGLQNVLTAEVVACSPEQGETLVRLGDQQLRLPFVSREPGRRILLGVRPEDLVLALEPVSGTSFQNQLKGRVTRVWRAGSAAMVELDVGQRLLAEITPRSVRELKICEGRWVRVLVKARALKPLSALDG